MSCEHLNSNAVAAHIRSKNLGLLRDGKLAVAIIGDCLTICENRLNFR